VSIVLQLFPQDRQDKYPRRLYGTCHRCERVDFLPWSTDLGVKYCGHCWEKDAIAYMKLRNREPDIWVAE
jgi:hypothetical protein